MANDGSDLGPPVISEVIPKSGLVYSEKGSLTYALCKPKIMPIKSVTLQKLEEMEKKAAELGRIDVEGATVAAVENNEASNLEKIREAAAKAETAAKRDAERAMSKRLEEEAKRKFAASQEGAAVREGKSSGAEANVWRADD